MIRALLLALVMFSGLAQAGYTLTVTAKGPSYFGPGVGTVTGCYLLPTMAINTLYSNGYGWLVLSIDDVGNWSAKLNNPGTPDVFTGTYTQGACITDPGIYYLPAMATGVTDPAISPEGVLSGASNSGGSMTEVFDPVALQMASVGALMMLATGFGVGLIIQLVRRLRTP